MLARRSACVRTLAFTSLLLLTLLGCQGDLPEGPQRPDPLLFTSETDAGSDPRDGAAEHCLPTLESIRTTIFAARCATAGCHIGPKAAAALDLTRTDLSARLIGASASSCSGPTLVSPAKPESSLLLTKMNGHLPDGCGEPMPPSGAPLSTEQLACVRDWIAGLSTLDAGVASDAGDAATCATCGSQSCVDLRTSAQHCGACGRACPARSTCSNGACRCPSGLSLCGGGCVDPTSDPTNCGSCGVSCSAGSTCAAGACTCGTGLTSCNGACVETATDPNNCQGCSVKCASNQLCTQSGCASAASCGSLTQCGSACVDTSSSLAHCGACYVGCAAGQRCEGGSCVCPNGATLCGTSCIDTQTNALHCGSCGRVCPSGTSCNAGVCTCAAGESLCDGSCTDTTTDANHCGECGVVCGAGKRCEQGSCRCIGGPATFATISPILVENCTSAGCHAGAVPKAGLNLTASQAYRELVDVRASQCTDGRSLVPSSGTGPSYLLQKLYGQDMCAGTKMPKADSTLPAAELAKIEAWICNGALP